MPQVQLPVFPAGTTEINESLAFEHRDGQVVYFNGHLPVVQKLLAAGAFVNMSDWTPLMYAAMNGHNAVVLELLTGGAEIDAQADNGFTALICAARGGHKEVVQILLDKKANPNIASDRGETALDWAMKTSNTDAAELLRKAGGKSGKAQ